MKGTLQAFEILLGSGKDETPLGQFGEIDWFRDKDLTHDEPTLNFCTSIQNYAKEHQINLERPETYSKRALKWNVDMREDGFESTFAGMVYWGSFKSTDNFTGSPQQSLANTQKHAYTHKPLPHYKTVRHYTVPYHTATYYTTLYHTMMTYQCQTPPLTCPAAVVSYLYNVPPHCANNKKYTAR